MGYLSKCFFLLGLSAKPAMAGPVVVNPFLNLSMSGRKLFLAIFIVSMMARITLMVVFQTYRELERNEVLNTAISVAEGHGFANAFGPDSGPTAHVSPLYPLVLSLAFRVFGTGQSGAFAQQVIGYGLTSAAYASLPAVAGALGLPILVGATAGIAAALLPINFWAERATGNNASAALLIALILVYCGRVWTEQRFLIRSAIVGGSLIALAALAEPVTLTLIVAIMIAGIVATRFSYPSYWSVAFAVSLVLVLPWAARNYRALGSPVWTRSNLGLELAVSNADDAQPTFSGNVGGTLSRLQPYCSPEARRKMIAMGEIAYNADCFRMATTWIATHPRRFVEYSFARFATFWFPFMFRLPQTVYLWTITMFGLTGFVKYLLSSIRWSSKVLALILFLIFPIPYYLIQTSVRYRFPIEPFVLLFACYFIVSLLQKVTVCVRLRRTENASGGVSQQSQLPAQLG